MSFPRPLFGEQPSSMPLDPKQQICFDFTKGSCRRGVACKYSHDPEVIASVNSHERGICFDWLRGSCTRGIMCRFSHDITNLMAQQHAQQLQQQGSPPARGLHLCSRQRQVKA